MLFGPERASATDAHRIFYALWPTDAVRDALAACIAGIKGMRARWVPRDKLHLTLWFVGAVTPAQLQRCSEVPGIPGLPFTLTFTRLRYQRRRQLLWVETEAVPSELSALETGLRNSLTGAECCGDPRPLLPHVTLGRKAVVQSPLPREIEPIRWPVDSVVLVESVLHPAGASYHVLRRWPLCSIPPEGSMK